MNDAVTTPPVAPRRDHVWARPTGESPDPYAWLRDREDPATIEYLEQENAHAERWFSGSATEIETMFAEIKSRIKEDDEAYPVRHRDWWYTSRTETGRSYPIHTRGRTVESCKSQLLLDENVEAAGCDYFSINAFEVSNAGALLAWSKDTDGSEKYTLLIRDLAAGEDLPDVIPGTTWGGTAWSSDDQWVFYVTPDDAMRPYRVWRHRLGTEPAQDELVYEESDERFTVGIDATRSGRYILVGSASRTSSEYRIIDADAPRDAPRLVVPRRDDIEYHLDHWGDVFAVVTNLDAVDFCVHLAPVDDPARWTPLVPHVPGSRIVQFDCFESFAVMQRWVEGQQDVLIVERDGSTRRIPVLEEPHEVEIDANPDYATDGVRLVYQSLSTPRTTSWFDVTSGAMSVLKRTDTPNCTLDDYISTRVWASSHDGTKVPVDLIRHVDTPMDGSAPVMLYVYGAYEVSLPPWFSVARLSLVDRGWVWALAHPRGGGEMGRSWYLDGKLLAKANTFLDTIACAEHLVRTKVCHPERIVIRGGSAGGLTVGACMTMRPGLFAGVIAEVPFVDVVTTMSDPTLPLTVGEWEEWGDPRVEPFASCIESYSPYDNVTDATYPDVYVTAGLNDPRVSFHEPAKWVAKIRHLSPGTTVVFRCEMGAGHGGPSGRYDQWRDEARTLAFALRCLVADDGAPSD